DGALTEADFDFSANALAPSPGASVFLRADRDGNGKVTREEFAALFDQWDRGGQGFLSLSDLQDVLPAPAAPRAGAGASPPRRTRPTAGRWRATTRWASPSPSRAPTTSVPRSPAPAAPGSAWASPCWWTPSTTPSAAPTAACPAAST